MFKSLIIILTFFGIFAGIIWITSHAMVCTEYQVVSSVEPYQKTISVNHSTYVNGQSVRLPSTETQTWYYIHLKNGGVLDRDYIDSKVRPGNEICTKWEWRSK